MIQYFVGKVQVQNAIVMFSCCFNYIDLIFYNSITNGDDLFQVGDAVELNPSAHRTTLSGDYKVLE